MKTKDERSTYLIRIITGSGYTIETERLADNEYHALLSVVDDVRSDLSLRFYDNHYVVDAVVCVEK